MAEPRAIAPELALLEVHGAGGRGWCPVRAIEQARRAPPGPGRVLSRACRHDKAREPGGVRVFSFWVCSRASGVEIVLHLDAEGAQAAALVRWKVKV